MLTTPPSYYGAHDMESIHNPDERVLHRRHTRHGAHRTKMSSAYRRHQSLVRYLFLHHHTATFLPYSVLIEHSFGFWIRLEERGLIVHGAARSSSASREGEGAKRGEAPGNVVVVKTGKKKMDQERYLDATQRYVYAHHLIYIISYLIPSPLATFFLFLQTYSFSLGRGSCALF
jgi:hypothetical protein